MSELQIDGDAAAEVQTETTPVEDQAPGAELAPDSDGKHEENSQVDEAAKQQAATQKVINEKHFQAKQAERERDEALAKIATFEQEKRDVEAAEAGDIPDLPGEFDENFAEKMAERDAAITRRATFEAGQANHLQQQQSQQIAAQQKEAADFQDAQIAYTARSAKLDISPQELQAAGNVVAGYGLPDQLVMHILNDKAGPLITKHLAEHPADAMTLASMSAYTQGEFLSEIRVKAEALKPKQTKTPPPPDNITGNGAQAIDANVHPFSVGGKVW